MKRELARATRSVIIKYTESFIELKKEVKEGSKEYKELDAINHNLNHFRCVFFRVLRDTMRLSYIPEQIVNSMKYKELMSDVNSDISEQFISAQTYYKLFTKARENMLTQKSICKAMNNDEKLLYVSCVMRFNDVIKEVGIYEYMQ